MVEHLFVFAGRPWQAFVKRGIHKSLSQMPVATMVHIIIIQILLTLVTLHNGIFDEY